MPRAVWNGTVIAESDDVEVVDGYTYFPTGSVNADHLRRSEHRSTCAWKGAASYFDVVVGDEVNRDAAWEYQNPSDRAAPLVGGRIGFWRGVRTEADATSSTGPTR